MTAPTPAPQNDDERLARLRLIRSENVGPVTFRHLLLRFGSAGRALDALPDLAARGGLKRKIALCSAQAAETELKAARKAGAHLLFLGATDYPAPLAALEDAPPVLFATGHLHLMTKPTVAMVGARNASAAGRRMAATLAKDLGAAGYVIASGLARGIDGVAHAAAVPTGTVAVLAGGLNVVYPPEHQGLYDEIATQGVLLAEAPWGTEPQARHFPRRNRIISGIAQGVVVVEASLRSGSLITAQFAATQGREVLAVPGSPLDPRSAGANRLIKDGAALVETADDVIHALAALDNRQIKEPDLFWTPTPALAAAEDDISLARTALGELLGPTPCPIDELIRAAGTPPGAVLTVLLELELAGQIERQPGNKVAKLA